MKITRRDFIQKTAALTLALGAPPVISRPAACYGAGQTKTSLAVVTGDRIPATKKAIELLGGMEKL